MFRQILIGAWGIYVAYLVLALVFPRQMLRLGLPMVIFGVILICATFLSGFIYFVRRRIAHMPLATKPVERVLVAGWIFAIGAFPLAMLLPQEKWQSAPEVLLVLFSLVVLSSMLYGAFLILRHVINSPGPR